MNRPRTAALLSYRLGGTDGVSIEAAKWKQALAALGFSVRTVAGEGQADHLVRGLAREPAAPPAGDDIERALDGADVVVVENLLSLPMNQPAAVAVERVLRGRPAVLHHHDLAWQRPQHRHLPPPPHDARWTHVTINEASRRELRERAAIDAVCLYNRFPLDGWAVSPVPLDAGLPRPIVLHPVRAIPRKDVPAALRLAEALGGTYWLTGPAEDGYGAQLEAILATARTAVIHQPAQSVAGAYAAADVVAFPSTVEGFGNPVVESALARRPLAIHRYPVADELAAFGFRWLDAHDPPAVAAFLREPDSALLDANEEIARQRFGIDRLPDDIAAVLERVL